MALPSPAQGSDGRLDVSGIVAASLAAWPKLMLAFGPVYALQVLPDVLQGQIGTPQSADGTALLTMFVADLVGLLVGVVCLGGLTVAAMQVLDGGQPRILDAVAAGLRRFWPVSGACFLAGLAVLSGFILLVVPGCFLGTWFFLVVPVCVLEGLGPRDSLRRSSALSKGQRWRIGGLLAVLVLAGCAAAACTYAADAAIGGLGAAVFDMLAGTAVGIFAGTVPVVTYRALAPENVRHQAARRVR